MAINGYTVGNDIEVDLNTQYGLVSIPKITSFTAKPKYSDSDVTAMSGKTDTLLIPINWSGTVEAEKQDDTIDAFFALVENNYFNGVSITPGTITQTIANPDNSVSVYRFPGVQFKFTDAGKYEGNKTVKQSLEFTAPRRVKVS
jgi:hypothetical protein